MDSSYNIRYIKGVGEKRAELFRQLGVVDVGTLLRLYPRSYQDRTHPLRLCEAPFDKPCCIRAKITTAVSEHYIRGNLVIYKFLANDGNEDVSVTLYNQKYAAGNLITGEEYLFYGTVERTFISCTMTSPQIYNRNDTALMPVYPQVAGLSSKLISKAVASVIGQFVPSDPLPEPLREKYGLCGLSVALHNIHLPCSPSDILVARKRLVFEELFFLQVGILFQKSTREQSTNVIVSGKCLDNFLGLLPFTLTDAQLSAVKDCISDTESGKPMRRLIEGDVGSGKTMVAAAMCFLAVKSGYQTVVMVPTEVLASQHFGVFSSLFEKCGISTVLLTGSVTKAKKVKIKQQISDGTADIVIGTHAVLSDDVVFNKLGLVITDEQHRFGVEQRTVLTSKGNSPHMMVMSATPIPRTMSLIFYGDLDLSIIGSLPKDRMPIETYLIGSDKRERALNYIKSHLDAGRQGYIVCPAVGENDESESDADVAGSNLATAIKYYDELANGSFKDYRLGLLHGKMKSKDKYAVMTAFANGEIDLLISTTVIEVGIDVPNAVIMFVENAERFGLSQLHQLRGRIGRGKYRSTCILLSDMNSGTSKARLKFLCKNTDGFKIADEDLKLRGPGDFLGKRQHGLPELKIADLSEDMELFHAAGNAAKELHLSDPELRLPENGCLKSEISRLFSTTLTYGYN